MKTLVIGDLHGSNVWKEIITYEKPEKVIFLGDYFDSFTIECEVQINNFLDLIELKKNSGIEVVLLIGNHDIHYFPYIDDKATAGYQFQYKFLLEDTLKNNLEHLSIVHRMGNLLFTHAGISVEFLDKNIPDWNVDNVVESLEDLFKYQPNKFLFNGSDPYGCDTYQTPLWIRPNCLMKANKKSELHKKFVQVFGHTQIKRLDMKGATTGQKYYNLDTINSSGQYMILNEKNKMSFGCYKDYEKE